LLNEKILLIGEKFKGIFSEKENVFEHIQDNEYKSQNIKKIILSDTFVDLKVISVPIVSNDLLPDIILNSIKRLTTTAPVKENIDYVILGKDNARLDILVFLRQYNIEPELSKIKYFSIYHILEKLIEYDKYPGDVSFIINDEKTMFVYNFRDSIFTKRSIYFENDIETLKNQSLHYISLTEDDTGKLEGFIMVPSIKIKQAVMSLKKDIFSQDKNKNLKYLTAFAISAVILFAGISEVFLYNQNVKIKNMEKEIVANDKSLNNLKNNRGVSEDLYKKYIELQTKKSYVSDLFKLLYFYGKNNLEIQNLSCNARKFSISGTCSSDSNIEKSFMSSSYFKNINFYFSRNNNQIFFRIDGEIYYED
jgi:hypothetical protein